MNELKILYNSILSCCPCPFSHKILHIKDFQKQIYPVFPFRQRTVVSIRYEFGQHVVNYQILLVENNHDLRENITEILEIQNYRVFSFRNGKEGLAMAKLQKPNLILCAIKMPEMDSFQLLEHIRKISSLSSSRFVFFTTSGEKKISKPDKEWGQMIISLNPVP